MNKIMLIGNLGRDPEMNYMENGTAITKFSIAVTRYTKKNGEREQETEWFNIVTWRDLAERCSTYLKKGQKIYVEGRFQSRKYTDKQGVERTAYDVQASEIEFLTPKEHAQEKKVEAQAETDPFELSGSVF